MFQPPIFNSINTPSLKKQINNEIIYLDAPQKKKTPVVELITRKSDNSQHGFIQNRITLHTVGKSVQGRTMSFHAWG